MSVRVFRKRDNMEMSKDQYKVEFFTYPDNDRSGYLNIYLDKKMLINKETGEREIFRVECKKENASCINIRVG